MNQWKPTLMVALATVLLVGAAPAQAADALDDCWAKVENREALGECLAGLKKSTDAELTTAYDRALVAQQKLDAATGTAQASRALERSQLAFVLYRDLHCHVKELQAGSGTGSGDFYTGCWINQNRARIAALNSLAPERDQMALDRLAGVEWIAESIGGKSILDETQPTLSVAATGEIGGSSGCNRYFGSAKIDGNTIGIGPLGATRRACPPPIMDQETQFLQALGNAKTFRIDNGLLVMTGADGTAVLTFRPKK